MKPFSSISIILGIFTATLIARRGLRRKSLSPLGAATAWIVGFLSISCGARGFVLLMFYQIGTLATKYRKDLKLAKDGDAQRSSVRGPSQVLACSAIAVICSFIHAVYLGEEQAIDFQTAKNQSILACIVVSHHATCLADTLASELGILSKAKPFLLIAPWQQVPPGTNGGVTLMGFFWSSVGGLLMGVGTLFMDKLSGIHNTRPWEMMIFSSLCGLLGSVLDSFLGALVQATYYDKDTKLVYCNKKDAPKTAVHIGGADILTNAQVNFASVLVASIVGGLVLAPCIFQ